MGWIVLLIILLFTPLGPIVGIGLIIYIINFALRDDSKNKTYNDKSSRTVDSNHNENQNNYFIQDILQKTVGQYLNKKIVCKTDPPPLCPSCNSEMVLRTARKGIYEDMKFYGCIRYPSCDCIVNIKEELLDRRYGAKIAEKLIRKCDPVPKCPYCNSLMLLRTAQDDYFVGMTFYRCPRTPDCNYIVDIKEEIESNRREEETRERIIKNINNEDDLAYNEECARFDQYS
jgi:ssDNA-binding Zn-finger/Zn-ribbon topoisomerase 1